MVWITVRVVHHTWKVDILVIPCFREIIISTTENSVIMLVAFPKSKVLEKCNEARRKPVVPLWKSKRMKLRECLRKFLVAFQNLFRSSK